jgi:hypothetical protein
MLSLAIWLVIGCSNETLKPSELIHWVNDSRNGLIQKQMINNFDFEVLYKPTDYVIALEGRTDQLTEEAYTELKSSVGDMQYLDLKIRSAADNTDALSGAIESQDDYYVRLDYFVTYAYQDIRLVQGRDTLSPLIYHFERTYGLTPYNTILLGFEKTESPGDRTLIIDDQILGIGRVKFVFDEEKINETPTLKRI